MGNFSVCDNLLDTEQQRLSQSSHDIIPLLILKAQTFILRRDYSKAEEIISSLNDLKYTPAVISTIYQLKNLQEDPETPSKPPHAISYLLLTAKKLDDPSLQISESLRATSLFQISQELEQNGYYEETATTLQSLMNRCSSSIDSTERFMISSKIAIALSYVLPADAEKITRSLPKVIYYLFVYYIIFIKLLLIFLIVGYKFN